MQGSNYREHLNFKPRLYQHYETVFYDYPLRDLRIEIKIHQNVPTCIKSWCAQTTVTLSTTSISSVSSCSCARCIERSLVSLVDVPTGCPKLCMKHKICLYP